MGPRQKMRETGATTRPARKMKADTSEKNALSRENIVEAALRILDSDGYDALSMRRLGKELGVNPMAVYYHIPNKQALLDALTEVVMSSIDLTLDDPNRTVDERLLTAANTYRDALLAHRSLIRAAVCLTPRTPASLKPVEVLLTIFTDAGFSVDDAFTSMNVLASFVRGSVISEVTTGLEPHEAAEVEADFSQLAKLLPPGEFPNLVKVDTGSKCFEAEAMFDRGARALIRGLLETYGNKEDE